MDYHKQQISLKSREMRSKVYLVVCVWIRPVTRAVAAVEVVVVVISGVLLIFGLRVQEIQVRTQIAETQLWTEIVLKPGDSQEPAGKWIPQTCYFHNRSENSCGIKRK